MHSDNPLCFFLRKLTSAEINYDIHDKEMLGIVKSLKEFRPWVSGTILPVSVIMVHKNLEYFMTLQKLNRKQAQWALEIHEYNFTQSWAHGSNNRLDGPLGPEI